MTLNFSLFVARLLTNGLLMAGAWWLANDTLSQSATTAVMGSVSALLIVLLRRTQAANAPWFAVLETAIDLALATLWLWTLRIPEHFFWLYFLPCGAAALTHGVRLAWVCSISSAALYWAVVGALNRQMLPLEPVHWLHLIALMGVGALFAVVSRRELPETAAPSHPAQQRWLQTLNEVETSQRELRARYRELAYHYRHLQEAMKETQDSLEVLSRVRAIDEEDFYQKMLEHLSARFGASGAVLWLLDESGLQLRVRASCGALARYHEPLQAASQQRVKWIPSVAQRLTQYLTSLPKEELQQAHASPVSAQGSSLRSQLTLSIPLRTPDRYYGILSFATVHTGGFEPSVEERLLTVAPHITSLIALQEQLQDTQQRMQELNTLHALDQILFSTLAPGEIAQRTLSLIRSAIPFSGAALYLINDQRQWEQTAAEGEYKESVQRMRFEKGDGLAGWFASDHKPFHIENAQNDARFSAWEPGNPLSLMVASLVSGHQARGALVLEGQEAGAFHESDFEMVQVLAAHLTLILERARLLSQLETLAITDGLTGLYNYRYFQTRLRDEIKRAKRYQSPFSLILIDLDQFKQVNDQFSHLEGDHMLIQFGELLRASMRETEIIARYGGDEFAVLLPTLSLKEAASAAERVRQLIESHAFRGLQGDQVHHLTACFGVAGYPDSCENPEDLLRTADVALEKAKRFGRNRVAWIEKPE